MEMLGFNTSGRTRPRPMMNSEVNVRRSPAQSALTIRPIHGDSGGGPEGDNATPALSELGQPASSDSNATGGVDSVVEGSTVDAHAMPSSPLPGDEDRTLESLSILSVEDTAPLSGSKETEKSERPRNRLSGAQRRKLKREKRNDRASANSKGGAAREPSNRKKAESEDRASADSKRGAARERKRSRATYDTPDSGRSKRNRKDNPEHPSYAAAASSALMASIGICSDPKRWMSDEEVDHLKLQLKMLVDGSKEPVPQFQRCRLRMGALEVTCANDTTLEWLNTRVPDIPKLNGVGFRIRENNEPLKLVRFRVYVPTDMDKLDSTPTILGRLAKQNPGLHTDRWTVNFRDDRDSHSLIGVSVDIASAEKLEQLQLKPYLGLGRVTCIRAREQGAK